LDLGPESGNQEDKKQKAGFTTDFTDGTDGAGRTAQSARAQGAGRKEYGSFLDRRTQNS
jgi:hypothetical protein